MLTKPTHWIVATIALLGLGSWMALAAHENGANKRPAAKAPLNCKATPEMRKACAAAAVCQEQFGPAALHYWTPDGQLICSKEVL